MDLPATDWDRGIELSTHPKLLADVGSVIVSVSRPPERVTFMRPTQSTTNKCKEE